jgi:DNA polymerase III delta prime subunit
MNIIINKKEKINNFDNYNKDIHSEIKNKLDYFIKNHSIPHIIFYGKAGSGKRFLLDYFINKIYKNDKEKIKEYVMFVNCAHCKGIRFIRDQLKFFAKRNMQNNNGKIFKSIILSNAENLTNDAQSALRRCIETFSHNTRFFIVIEDIEKILSPILSRFCNIYIPYPKIEKVKTNLYDLKKINSNKNKQTIKKYFKQIENLNIKNIQKIVDELYLKGISGLDIIDYIKDINNLENSDYLFFFEKIKKEFRNEKLLMFIYVYYYFMRKKIHLENLVKM